MTPDIRGAVQAGSVVAVAGAIVLGAVAPGLATQFDDPTPEPAAEVIDETIEPVQPFDPADMAAAARLAKQIELQRAKRADRKSVV